MNRLIQSGIGLGLSAGAVLMPQQAHAGEVQLVAQECDTRSNVLKAIRIGSAICRIEQAIIDEINPEPPKTTQADTIANSETDRTLRNYSIGLGIVLGEVVALGAVSYSVRKKYRPQIKKSMSEREKTTIDIFHDQVRFLNMDEIEVLFQKKPAIREQFNREK